MSLEAQGYDGLQGHERPRGRRPRPGNRPDLVLMDMMMPVLNGYEAVGELKADATTRDIPIVGLSAKAMSTDMERGPTSASTATSPSPSASPRC